MGNRLGRKKVRVEEEYTRPRGIHHQPCNVDYKKLRRLIRSGKLAPCFPGQDERSPDLEECPICFYYFPSLNRSRCCTKSICTECFLQMKPQDATRPAQCPFCKSGSYAVEYRGARTQEEKTREIEEEQKVIEAKIRMQCQEQQDSKREAPILSEADRSIEPPLVMESDDPLLVIVSTEGAPAVLPDLHSYTHVNGEFGTDIEEIMLMEAICLSVQENPFAMSTTWRSGSCSNSRFGGFVQTPSQTRLTLTYGTEGQVRGEMSVTVEDAYCTAATDERDKLQPESLLCNQQTLYGTVKDSPETEDDLASGNSSNSTRDSVAGAGALESDECFGGAMADESPSLDFPDGCITSWSLHSTFGSDTPCSSLSCCGDYHCVDKDTVQHQGLHSVLCNHRSIDVKTIEEDVVCEACDCDEGGPQNHLSSLNENEILSTFAEANQQLQSDVKNLTGISLVRSCSIHSISGSNIHHGTQLV